MDLYSILSTHGSVCLFYLTCLTVKKNDLDLVFQKVDNPKQVLTQC